GVEIENDRPAGIVRQLVGLAVLIFEGEGWSFLTRLDKRHRDIIGLQQRSVSMRKSVQIAALLAFVALTAHTPAVSPIAAAAAGPELQSIGPLTFGPDGVLYAADSLAGKIYALTLGAQ